MTQPLFFAAFFGCCIFFVMMLRHISVRSGWPRVAEHYPSPKRISDGDHVTIAMNTITCPSTLTKKNETLYVSAYLRFSLFLPSLAIPIHRLRKIGLDSSFLIEMTKFEILASDDSVVATLHIPSNAKIVGEL